MHARALRLVPSSAVGSAAEADRLTRFLADLAARGRRELTIGAYRSDWTAFACWSAGANGEPFDLARLVGREVTEFRAECLRRQQAPATVNRRLAFLSEYVRWAAARREVRDSLVDEVARVPTVPKPPLAPRGLRRFEVRRFLKEVDVRGSARDRAVVYVLLYTGLRRGELAGLQLSDVALNPRGGLVRLRPEHAKGGKPRDVPLPATARARVAEYIAERGGQPGALFLGERGPLGRNGVARIVAKYADAAKLKLSPHTLRHCFAYRYLETTSNDLVGLSVLLGHGSLNTTMTYTRKRFEDLERAMDGLEFA